MDRTPEFEAERPRLLVLAGRVLGDPSEAEDIVQQAWLRMEHGAGDDVRSLPAWLTTVTTRLCLDRLRVRTPIPFEEPDDLGVGAPDSPVAPDPADEVALTDSVGAALHVVLDRLTPRERVAFVLHDSLGYEHAVVAEVLDTTSVAARQLASRARAKTARSTTGADLSAERRVDAGVVDAFMLAARGGDLAHLLQLLAPDSIVLADADAVRAGTPSRIEGREPVAAFFDGSAHAALAVDLDGRPAYAWYHRGKPRVLFDFEVDDGVVQGITFRADPDVLSRAVRRHSAPPAGP